MPLLCITEQTCVHAVPEKGGVYLILQGGVEKLSQDCTTGEISSSVVGTVNAIYQYTTQYKCIP